MALLQQLDAPTLAFVTGLAGLMLAMTMAGIRLAGMRHPAVLCWGVAGLAAGTAHLLAHLTLSFGLALPQLLALSIANAMTALMHAMLLAGVRAFLGRRPHALPLAALALGVGSLAHLWPDGWQVMRNRILVLASIYLVLDLSAGLLLWRAGRAGRDRFHAIAAAALFLNVATLLARLAHALWAHAPASAFERAPFQTLVYVLGLVFVSQLTVGLALLMFRAKELELQRLVHRDPLTGLFNRRSLFEHAAREQARCERYGTPLSLVMLDIDDFKAVNDTFGHGAGDDVICETATRVACALRDVDAAFRLGGEEFLILLPSTALDEAVRVAERLRAAVSGMPIPATGAVVTASFGVTELARGQEDWEAAMRRADAALYRAKDDGRDRVVAMTAPARRHGPGDVPAAAALDVP